MTNTDSPEQNEPATPAHERALAIRQALIADDRGLRLKNYDDYAAFALKITKSQFMPQGFQNEHDVFIALQKGAECGLTPMQSLESIYVVNNRATFFGDTPKALCEASGLMVDYDQYEEGKRYEDSYKWIVSSQRKGRKPLITTYSVADAKIAKLWGKAGAWTTAPWRMLMFRARSYNLRDNFSDVLKGIQIGELVDDGENLPGFENAKEAKVVTPNFGGQAPEPRSELMTPAVGSGIMSEPVKEPTAPSEPPPKRGPGRPRKLEQPPLIPEEKPMPKIDPIPVTGPEPSLTKPADQKAELVAKVKAKLEADRIPIQAFLKMMHENAFIDADPKDIELGHVNLEDVDPGGLATALDVWDTDIRQRLGGGK